MVSTELILMVIIISADSTKERNDIELSKCSDDVTYNDIVESPDDDDDGITYNYIL